MIALLFLGCLFLGLPKIKNKSAVVETNSRNVPDVILHSTYFFPSALFLPLSSESPLALKYFFAEIESNFGD